MYKLSVYKYGYNEYIDVVTYFISHIHGMNRFIRQRPHYELQQEKQLPEDYSLII